MKDKRIANWELQISNCKLNEIRRSVVTKVVCGFVVFCGLLCNQSITFADANAAVNKVREGIAEFHKRDFKAALKAFEDAESIAPDDLRLAFDRGCAYAAQGETEQAIEQFQKSATAQDKKLAVLSNYNLGCLAVARAKAIFSEKPEEAEGDVRTQGLEMIDAACRRFRDALNLDSQDAESRYNLEMLRVWSKHIQKTWKDRDRQQRREKSNLLEYLQLLETEQRALRTKAKELLSIAQDSPRKRQSVREAENNQRELAEEIGPLKQKIDQLAAGQGRGPSAEATLPADAQKAIDMLKSFADGIGKSMQAAADRMAENLLPESIEPQTNAIESLDQIFSAVAPYTNLVQKGITRQEELIGEKTTTKPDYADAAWNQRFIERYGKIIPLKAKQELKQLESQPASESQPTSESQPASTSPSADAPPKEQEQKTKDEKTDAALKAEQQRRDMKESLQLGIELSPKVEQLAREAGNLLSQEKPTEALPKQQEAVKLLKEMLPKQQQEEQDKKDQEKKDEQKKKDQENKDQKKDQKKDQENKNQDKDKDKDNKDQQKKDQDKKNQKKKDQEKKDKQDREKQKQDQQKNKQDKKQSAAEAGQMKEMSKEQAEESLRRAQLRREEYRLMIKDMEEKLYRPEKVEKDW